MLIKAERSEVIIRLWQKIFKEINEGMSGSLLIGEKEALMLERGYPEVKVLMISIKSCFRLAVSSKSRRTEKGNIIATQIGPSGQVEEAAVGN